MNATMVEGNCAACLLRMTDAARGSEPERYGRNPDPENAPERQLEQLEHTFGPDWKW